MDKQELIKLLKTDVQKFNEKRPPGVIDLSKANLSKANLSEANLSEADLSEADLSEADLSGANLQRSILCDANLEGARVSYRNTEKIIKFVDP